MLDGLYYFDNLLFILNLVRTRSLTVLETEREHKHFSMQSTFPLNKRSSCLTESISSVIDSSTSPVLERDSTTAQAWLFVTLIVVCFTATMIRAYPVLSPSRRFTLWTLTVSYSPPRSLTLGPNGYRSAIVAVFTKVTNALCFAQKITIFVWTSVFQI